MGEARQRRLAIERGAPAPFQDMATGQIKRGRLAPSIPVLRARMQDMTRRLAAGERFEAKVPCNGCTACCYFSKVGVDPAQERAEDLAHLDLVADPEPQYPGALVLRKRADGACIHLGPDGCTVRAHRPHVCRTYDCRLSSGTGMAIQYGDGSHTSPHWVPAQHTREERMQAFALVMGAQEYQQSHPGISQPAEEIVAFVWARFDDNLAMLRQLADRLDALPTSTQRQLCSAADCFNMVRADAARQEYATSNTGERK